MPGSPGDAVCTDSLSFLKNVSELFLGAEAEVLNVIVNVY